MDTSKRIELIRDYLSTSDDTLSARIYGSSCFERDTSEDVDLAVMVYSDDGVCDFDLFDRLRITREELSSLIKGDVDLIPHTTDELGRLSPLNFPRYNPSLLFGIDVKGSFPVEPINSSRHFSLEDLCEFVLLDSRTITRRQILRPTSEENIRIFLSKLAHGPGNVMTFLSAKEGSNSYLANPSDIKQSFLKFHEYIGLDMSAVLSWINVLRHSIKEKTFNPSDAFPLITWYESLVSGCLKDEYSKLKSYLIGFKRPGVLLVVTDKEGRMLFLHRDDKPNILNPGVWYPPTETIELEHPDQTAIRCGREELGLELHLDFLRRDIMSAGHPRFIYTASLPHGGEIHLGEGQGYGFFRKDQLDSLRIPDGARNFLNSLFSN